jgi:hypothetical protein
MKREFLICSYPSKQNSFAFHDGKLKKTSKEAKKIISSVFIAANRKLKEKGKIFF